MKNIVLALLMVLLFLTSCRNLVQDEFPEFENKITINSIVTSKDSIKLFVSVTDELNASPLKNISNANIIMYNQDSQMIHFNYMNDSMYISDCVPSEGDSLYLLVNVPEYGEVNSTCCMPIRQEALDIKVKENAWINDEGEGCRAVSFKIANNPQIPQYYEALIRELRYAEKEIRDENDSIIRVDTVLASSGQYSIALFDNLTIQTDYMEKYIEYQNTYSVYNMRGIKPYKFHQLILRSVDANYYQFMKSLELYDVGREPNFSNSSIIPSNIYSNIENGYGIFGAYSEFISDSVKSTY